MAGTAGLLSLPVPPGGCFVVRQVYYLCPCHQEGVSWHGRHGKPVFLIQYYRKGTLSHGRPGLLVLNYKIRDSLRRLEKLKITMREKGFFFCSSKNLNSRQKPKNNIVRGCFCRDSDTIFVSVGTGDASRHGTVTIVRKSLKEPERKRRKRRKRQEKADSNYEERTSGRKNLRKKRL